jgi:hypothetical protein
MSAVDRLYNEAISIIDKLDEVSLQISASDQFRKSLLLAAASYFESHLSNEILKYVSDCSGQSATVHSFVRTKAVERQYHTWFDWQRSNANQFFGLFGDEFKSFMKKAIDDSQDLKESMSAFMEIGRERNKLVHQDYATFQMEKTLEEVYALYKRAEIFATEVPTALRKHA